MWPSASSSGHRANTARSEVGSSASGYSATSSVVWHNQFAPNRFGASSSPSTSSSSPHSASARTQTMTSDPAPVSKSSFGIMVVGLGGANGTTMLAGILANRLKIDWHGPKGEHMTPNYNGCITQLDSRGVHGGVGFRNLVQGLGDANTAAVGGWDIRPTKPGDALLQAQILDYDLVRQVQGEMNKVKLFRGLFDPRFIGSSQHETANHILTEQECKNDAEALKCLRADIRYFKWRNGIVGHTTVIWSASVEPNSDLLTQIWTADHLMQSIGMTEEQRGGPLPPSILYATAAILEGCSFVNGGSQNTLSCPGLSELAQQHLGVYCLGTDFKAGQTKFKTAAVEYLRTMGLKPKVIASSNHLGNNDMRNLASAKSASSAKLKVKHDIFAPWQEEDLDHKVSIMFTPYINDDKRDFVEYTSLGFLGQPHTMVTYTRASDSVLCVPLMIDVAVWCDYFSQRSWSYEKVAKALAYLFKVPEGAAQGVDPGFFRQMEELKTQVLAAAQKQQPRQLPEQQKQQQQQQANSQTMVLRSQDEVTAEWSIPGGARVICAGLACVDMQLNEATGGDGGEGIETFEGETSIGGGSVSMACKTLARLCHGEPAEDGNMLATPPVVSAVVPLCMIGDDDSGNKLLKLLEECGSGCNNVDTRVVRSAQGNVKGLRTALSVLPIYRDGRRGCFFDAASNATFSAEQMIEKLSDVFSGEYSESEDDIPPVYGAMIFGYPHLLPLMQGQALAVVFEEARHGMVDGGIIVLDLNGVPDIQFATSGGLRSSQDLKRDTVIGPALEHVDFLHMNEYELALLTGCRILDTSGLEQEDQYAIAKAVELFLACGVAVVAVTRGRKGSYVACNNLDRMQKSPSLPQSWANCTAHIAAAELPPGTKLNTNGAGDSFTSGFLIATMLRRTGKPLNAPREANYRPKMPLSSAAKESPQAKRSSPKKMTPYTLYMRETYVALKSRYNNDKKAIFAKCHEMWEKETPDVRNRYDRKVQDYEEVGSNISGASWSMSDFSDPTTYITSGASQEYGDPPLQPLESTNEPLGLESAIQFAGLVAANHVNISTRDLKHLNSCTLLQQAAIFPCGREI